MKISQIARFDTIVILGYGLEGKSSAQWLKAKFPRKIFSIKENQTDPLPVPAKNELFVISPGIDRTRLCAAIPPDQQTSHTEIFFANLTTEQWAKTIGISGSKGKSTTTKFCAECLQNAGYQVAIGGNFGMPLLDILEDADRLDFIVCELSSFQLEYLQISPKYALFLNLFVGEHGDRHHSRDQYLQSKAKLWTGIKKSADFLIIPRLEADQFPVDSHSDISLYLADSLSADFFPPQSIFQARHFCQNFGTVATLAKILPITDEKLVLKKTAENFIGLPYRLELFATGGGHSFYDDSIATTPEAAVAAIKWLGERLGAIVVGGDNLKPATPIIQTLLEFAPQAQLWLPTCANLHDIKQDCLTYQFPAEKIIEGQNFTEVLRRGLSSVPPDKAIILSPGAKSFDNFESYKIRGNYWKAAVRKQLG